MHPGSYFLRSSCPHTTHITLKQTAAEIIARVCGFRGHIRALRNNFEVNYLAEIFVLR